MSKIIVAAIFALFLLTGCANKSPTEPKPSTTTEQAVETAETTEKEEADTIVPEITDIETLEEMGLRDPANNTTNEQKEVYDNPIIQADSETYIEYLGKTISLKDYYEEIIRMDPEGCIKDGMLERVIAYMPEWASEHGYSLEDLQQPEPEKPATTNIEDNNTTPETDPEYIEDTTFIPNSRIT